VLKIFFIFMMRLPQYYRTTAIKTRPQARVPEYPILYKKVSHCSLPPKRTLKYREKKQYLLAAIRKKSRRKTNVFAATFFKSM
ncbi:MAG: hypothetical protein RSC00_02170, partial [Ruthenibacterium sp.]